MKTLFSKEKIKKLLAGADEYIKKHYVPEEGMPCESQGFAGIEDDLLCASEAAYEIAEDKPDENFMAPPISADKGFDPNITDLKPERPAEAVQKKSRTESYGNHWGRETASIMNLKQTGGIPAEAGNAIVPTAKLKLPKAAKKESGKKPSRSLESLMSNVAQTWQECLFRLIDEKGFSDTEVYKRANIDRKLFSKIRSNPDYQPKKMTAVAFALALRLSLDEVKDFLSRAGYALSPSSRFDLIIEYFVEEEVYDLYTINLALFEHDQPLFE